MFKTILILVMAALCLNFSAKAQTITRLTGRITTAADNKPLPGASIKIKSTNISTQTDKDGRFTISATENTGTLIISYTGYTTKELSFNTAQPTMLNVTLNEKPTTAPDIDERDLKEVEIVSTGYQNIPKERATGSFTQINYKKFNEQISTDILSRLESIANSISVSRKIAGTGNQSQLMVRGLSTIQGVKTPLIILDNFPYEGDINNINPNDVQNITILKDAAAASIWGTKAGNGVIVITTKKAKLNQRTTVEGTANITVTEKPDLFYLPQISSNDFINLEQYLFTQEYRFADLNSTNHPPFSPVYEILFKEQDEQISPSQTKAQIDALRTLDVRNDFSKYLYQNAVNQQYSFNINGGSSNMGWLLFGGYDKNNDEHSAKYNRLNLKIQNTWSPIQNFSVTINALYTQTNTISGKPSYSDISTSIGSIPPYTQIADASGNALPVIKDYRQTYLDAAGYGKLLDWNYYPLTDYQNINNTTKTTDILANLGIQYQITPWLFMDLKYQYEKQQSNSRNLQGIKSYYTRDLINRFTTVYPEFDFVVNKVPKHDILDLATNNLTSNKARGQLSLDKTFGPFNLTTIAGGEINQRLSDYNNYRVYGYNGDILTLVNVDYENPYSTFIDGSYSFIPSKLDFSKNLNRFVSTYANAAVTYKDKYTFSLSGRRDASNLFGVNTNNRWTPLWSAGLSWNLSKESFYKSSILSDLKLRATYGYSGNINPDATGVSTIAYMDTSPYTQTPMAMIDKFYNPDLRWEKVGILNLGLDFKMFNNKITGSIEYYQKNARDLFGNVPVDYTVGLGTLNIVKNVANMKGSGLDLELNTINFNSSVKWLTNINLSYYKDKVTQYNLNDLQGSNFINGGQLISGIKGKPVYAVYSYRWAGLDPANGDPQGYLNGQVSKDYLAITGNGSTINDLKYHGPGLPVVFGSMGNTISFKNLSLTLRLLYKFGHYYQRPSIDYNALFANSRGNADYSLRWQKQGDEKTTQVPSMIYPADPSRDQFYNGSEVLVEKGDNIRVQYINLSYDFTQTPKHGLSKLQVFAVLNNPGIIWKASRSPMDPDYNSGVIPPGKSISIGVKGSF